MRSLIFAIICVLATAAGATDRIAKIDPGAYSDEQKIAAKEFEDARKVPIFGPFELLINSPHLMTQARAMGDYLRYKSSIGNKLSEFVILIIAREWTQDFEWSVHFPIAIREGIKQDVVQDIEQGKRPKNMSEDETIIYDFVMELQRNHQVSEDTFNSAKKHFGENGIIDIGGIMGYYTLLAMELNAAQYPTPGEAKRLPRFPN